MSAFSDIHNEFLEAKKGAYSEVTETEFKDSQITLDQYEKEIALDFFGRERIHRGNKASNPEAALKDFLLHDDGKKVSLNLVFPKPFKDELRLYISKEAGFRPESGDIWFIYLNDKEQLIIGFMDKPSWNSISFKEESAGEARELNRIENNLDIIGEDDLVVTRNFKSRARLLPQLGDMLIKSEEVAFLELIKNSYDADARSVTVLMEHIDDKNRGIILIEDDGFGMNKEIIENVWLELGSDFKAKKAASRKRTELGRIPIGEKGIGRLGAHKLGDVIELISKKKGDKEVFVKIDWREFEEKDYLEDVEIKIIERSTPVYYKKKEHGTFISISHLKTNWARGKVRNIQRSITSITNPFEESNEQFKPTLELVDKPGWLEGVIKWDQVKDHSLYSFEVVLEGTEIKEFQYNFKPPAIFEKTKHRDVLYASKDQYGNLSNDQKLVLSSKSLKKKNESGKDETFSLENIGEIRIKGEIFEFDPFLLKDISDKSGLKKYVGENSGVKVYRGDKDAGYVRVYDYGEPGNDWLGLNLKRINVPVNLSNNLILVGVFLDREQSEELKEKTNREGFIEDENFEYFKQAVLHALSLVDVFRKADKKRLRDQYGPKSKQEPVHSSINKLRTLVDEKIKDKNLNTAVNSYLNDIESSYNVVYENLLKTASAGLGLGVVLHEIEKVIKELTQLLKANKEHDVFESLVKRLGKLVKGYSEIFRKSNKTDVEFYKIIEDALFSVEFRLRAHQIELDKNYLESKSAKAKVAKGLVEGVLINLIDNSIYWLEIAKSEHKIITSKKLYLSVLESNKFISIIVADNGTGFLIPTEQAISPMESGKTTGGWGLGLHIANEIMQSHDGGISFPEWGDLSIPDSYKQGAIVQLDFPK